MENNALVTIEDLFNADIEANYDSTISDFEIINQVEHPHSIVGLIKLIFNSGKEEKIILKKHTNVNSKNSTDPLEILHRREAVVLDSLYDIDKTKGLIPRPLGRITNSETGEYLLFTEYLGEESARDKIFKLRKRIRSTYSKIEKQRLERKRIRMIREGLTQIARFNGLCRVNKSQLLNNFYNAFGSPKEAFLQKQKLQKFRTIKYQLRRAHYWNLGGIKGKKFDEERTEDYLNEIYKSKGIDLEQKIEDIFEAAECTFEFSKEDQKRKGSIIRLQIGDCRLHHNFNGRFCDIEDFGWYPWYHDAVNYTSEEVSSPPIEKIPSMLALYLLYEKAYGSGSKDYSITELGIEFHEGNPLLDETVHERLKETVSDSEFSNFYGGYLFGTLIQSDIILDGINKKYSTPRLKKMYPGYRIKDIHRLKLNHIEKIYQNADSLISPLLLRYSKDNPDRSRAMKDLFYQIGCLEQELFPIDIEKGLKELI